MAIDVGTAVAYLDLDMTSFNTGLQSAQSALQTLSDTTSTIGDRVTAAGTAMANFGSALTRTVTVPVVNFAQSAIQNFRDYESAFAGVKKTINDDDLEKYAVSWDDLSDAVVRLAKESGISSEEIAGVMEVAGQLGVELGEQGKGIESFTRVMTMLGVATDMSAEEAALSLARFMNITGTTNEEVDNLGASITDLGNNFATQEAEIVNMSTRLASAGTVAGLTAQEILALATSMSSAGIKAEAGGSAMATTLTTIEKIVEGVAENSEDKLQILGKISGMTAEEFAKNWREKPIDALTSFLHGLGDLEEQGESSVVALDALGMSGVRQNNMLKALALSAENMDNALATANKSWSEATALEIEFSKRLETLDSKLGMLNERWKELKRSLAELVVPWLLKVMDYLGKVIDYFMSLDDATKESIIQFAAIAAAVGPVLMVFGRLLTGIGQLMNIFGLFNGVLTESGGFIGLLRGAFVGLFGETSALGSAISALGAGPFAALLVVIAAVIAAVIDLWKNNEEFRENVIRIWNAIKDFIVAVWDALKPIFEMFIEIFKVIVKALEPVIEILVAVLGPVLEGIIAFLTPILQLLSEMVQVVGYALLTALNAILPVIEAVIGFIGIIAAGIGELIKLVGEIAGAIIQFGVTLFSTVLNTIKSAWERIKKIFEDSLGGIMDAVKFAIEAIVNFFKWLKYVLIGDPIVVDLLNGLTKLFKEGFEFIYNVVKEVIEGIVKFFKWLVDNAIAMVKGFIQAFIDGFSNVANVIVNLFNNIMSIVTSFASKLIEAATNIGKAFVSGLLGVAQDAAAFFSNFMQTAINTIINFIPKMVEAGKKIFTALWDGMKAIYESLKNWISSVLSPIIETIEKVVSPLKSIFDGIKTAAGGIFSKITGSHSGGLDYVPYDGYVAELHQGEKVLTKQEAERYNQQKDRGIGVINFYSNEKIDEYQAARLLRRTIEDIDLGLV